VSAVDLVRAAQLLEEANKLSPKDLAARATFVIKMHGAPSTPEYAAVIEAALRFIAVVTGERPQVLP